MRVCRSCNLDENMVRFYSPSTVAGRAAGSMCQPCWVAKSTQWRHDNRDRWNKQRHYLRINRLFGLTNREIDELYKAPMCQGCGASVSRQGKRLTVDHDHKTGKMRGLLCHDCNRTIATAQDNPNILRQLAKYLEDRI